jgi:hypothetical protein
MSAIKDILAENLLSLQLILSILEDVKILRYRGSVP